MENGHGNRGALLGKECVDIELDESLLDGIKDLVKAGEFKSVDDFIELASHEYLLRHPKRALGDAVVLMTGYRLTHIRDNDSLFHLSQRLFDPLVWHLSAR